MLPRYYLGDNVRFNPRKAALVIVDMQDKLLKIIDRRKEVIKNIVLLLGLAEQEKMPVIITKQVKLGDIAREIKDHIPENTVFFEKKSFSIFGDEKIAAYIEGLQKQQLIITGIETHICILQSVMDALDEGYRVYVPPDATASQIDSDYHYTLSHMARLGAIILPSESLVYMAMKTSEYSGFKRILEMVKARRRQD